MDKLRNDPLEKQALDAALARFMDEYARAEGERLWQEFQEAQRTGMAPEMPPELDAACRRLIDEILG